VTFIKNKLRNKMGDRLLDDCLVTFIERDIFLQLSEEKIINTFMSIRRCMPDKKRTSDILFNYYRYVIYFSSMLTKLYLSIL
jgi:hypothetical protein